LLNTSNKPVAGGILYFTASAYAIGQILILINKKVFLTVWMKEIWSAARVATTARQMRSVILLCILSHSESLDAHTVLASRQFVPNKPRGVELLAMGK